MFRIPYSKKNIALLRFEQDKIIFDLPTSITKKLSSVCHPERCTEPVEVVHEEATEEERTNQFVISTEVQRNGEISIKDIDEISPQGRDDNTQDNNENNFGCLLEVHERSSKQSYNTNVILREPLRQAQCIAQEDSFISNLNEDYKVQEGSPIEVISALIKKNNTKTVLLVPKNESEHHHIETDEFSLDELTDEIVLSIINKENTEEQEFRWDAIENDDETSIDIWLLNSNWIQAANGKLYDLGLEIDFIIPEEVIEKHSENIFKIPEYLNFSLNEHLGFEKNEFVYTTKLVSSISVCIILLLLLAQFIFSMISGNLETKFDQVKNQYTILEHKKDILSKLQLNQDLILKTKNEKVFFSDALEVVGTNINNSVILTEIKIDPKKVILSGYCNDFSIVGKVLKKFENLSYFTSVKLLSNSSYKDDESKLLSYQFKMELEL